MPSVTQHHRRSLRKPSGDRYQAAISTPGIEVRMPSIHLARAEIKSRLSSFLLSLLLGASLYLFWTLPVFSATDAQVHGNKRLATNDINAVLDMKGQTIFSIIPSQLESRLLLNYPEIVSANVSLGLPNIVTVDVVERKPVILWQLGNGYTWIDNNGVAFRPIGNTDGLITVTGMAAPPPGFSRSENPFSPKPYLSADLVKAIQTLAPSVPKGKSMVYQPPYGLGWLDSRGWQVFFGSDPNNMALNLQVYQSLVNSLTKQGIKPALINVQYANAPYYRMSQ